MMNQDSSMSNLTDIIAPKSDPSLRPTTLDEPVWATLYRDLKGIGTKIFYVTLPFLGKGAETLRDWDLWGPFFLCFFLSIALRELISSDQGALVFSLVFIIVWGGSIAVTLNAQLLGGKVSFFQSICVLGYCIFPLNIASLFLFFWGEIFYKLIVVVFFFVWSTLAALRFLSEMVPPGRKALALYPIILFYFVLSWLLLIS
eukprot:TRINITY_DN11269_c0_g1_i1.p1 TRINITY_DN11269_c0_g1~~TRINITY_DN11269_c0_g1_i1.p1  ORF type:complete len:201 (-),score=30.87 TRINITY_DN11269_c0_g1_i1:102-704(-)